MVRWRILVVDDHIDALELIRMTLADEYDVLTLSNPLDFYTVLQLFEPDLIVLDIMMPKVTGFQIMEIMQRNETYRDIPIVILSAKDSAREIKYGYKLGARLYLTKPFQPERLKKNVQILFEHTPPTRKPKQLTIAQVKMQLQLKKAYQVGTPGASSTVLQAMEEEKQTRQKEQKRPTPPPEEDRRWEG